MSWTKEKARLWRLKNPDKCRLYHSRVKAKGLDKIWRKNNPEKLREYRRKHYWKNREKIIATTKLWEKKNIEKVNRRKKYWMWFKRHGTLHPEMEAQKGLIKELYECKDCKQIFKSDLELLDVICPKCSSIHII